MDPYASAPPHLLLATDEGFPARLSDLPTTPRHLWVRGRLPVAGVPLAAVVGSRAASTAAIERVFALTAGLCARGWGIVSGGALGIDAAAHRGALASEGRTFAVLGCGADVVYPDRHTRLFAQIVEAGGGLLSEYAPGTPPRRGQFPARNRLVAALADVVIVGECRAGSGALLTADKARALGRPLLAMPGSPGTDGLLAVGAALPAQVADDVIQALSGRAHPGHPDPGPAAVDLLAQALSDGALTADALARRLGWSLADTLGALCEAELRGLVRRAAGAKFEARFKGRFEAARGQ